ncbi:MAG: putative porin [Phycisphaerae bacterium]
MAAALITSGAAFGQGGDAILDLLTKKGVITQREANETREQLDAQNAQTVEAYNKVKVSSWVNSLQFYGDGRLRYEWRSGKGNAGNASGIGIATGPQDHADLDRFRYRFRVGVKGELADNFSYGLRLETATKGNSANVTMGGQGLSGGPFPKTGNDAIALGQFWAQYKYSDWLTLVGGKMENPFITSAMVWDGDLSPEGFAQKLKLNTDKVDWFLTLGEFTYNNTVNQNIFRGAAAGGNDSWLLGIQGGGKVKFDKDLSLTLAPTFYVYSNPNKTAGVFKPTLSGGNNTGIDDLAVVVVPVELAFPVPGLHVPGKGCGEFVVNTSAKQRADAALLSGYENQDMAYQFGASIGSSKKKHDWLVKAYWPHTELFALDPNLVDSDLFDGRLNMQGAVTSAQYLLTDFLTLGVTYANAHAINASLPVLSGTGDLKGNLRNYNLFQADLNWKF